MSGWFAFCALLVFTAVVAGHLLKANAQRDYWHHEWIETEAAHVATKRHLAVVRADRDELVRRLNMERAVHEAGKPARIFNDGDDAA